MESVHLAVADEIALEGLDGITLDALWFRLSERLKLPLPINKKFQNEIWKLVLSRTCFEYYEIDADRQTPKHMDRKEFYFSTAVTQEAMNEHMKSAYFVYLYCPVDDPEIRGSCSEFKTRRKLDIAAVKEMSLDHIYEQYNQRFVIVATQTMRNSVLIPSNLGRECDINNYVYCILERIGRSRYFGEATSGPFSLNEFIKDSKLLHYFRNCLLNNKLVVRQQIQTTSRGQKISSQLFHLQRFQVLVRATNLLITERLFHFLERQPNHIAGTEETRKHLNITQKMLASVIKARPNIFQYDPKCPYRKLFPNATKQQYMMKRKSKEVERTLFVVNLVNPTIDIFKLWHMEDETAEDEEHGFVNIANQTLNRPLIHQVCQKIADSGKEGMSQLELGQHFGLTKLNARSVLRKAQRTRNISFYMKDEGRQRISKFVTKEVAQETSQTFVAEMTKLLLKVDESATQAPIAMKQETSPTKVSIPLTPATLMFLKPEPSGLKHAIEFRLPANTEADTSFNDFVVPAQKELQPSEFTPVIIPQEDSSFVDNVENVTVSMRFLNNIPNMKKEAQGIASAVSQSRISQKMLTRMNAILDILKNKTVIHSMHLLQLMRDGELDLPEMICRKSMYTLCGKLAADNFLKVIEMELKSEKKSVKLLFFGDPAVSFDMRCWHSIIEEQKIQHFIPFHRNTGESENIPRPPSSVRSFDSKSSMASEEFGPQSQHFENFPKFMKMKLFHEFLFFLIHAYPEDVHKIPIQKAVEVWRKSNPKVFEHEPITENITSCYSTEISWKMFVSPLNPQRDYQNGWALLRDIIHRIPLILFMKFARYTIHQSSELNEYLNHPIKCNYLLHFLPGKIRESLLQGRKHVFAIQELCRRLCWCGLLQFGPCRTKEVDQSFVYLNLNASLLDTTSSEDGYLEVSDQEYPINFFHFDSTETVTYYWDQMYHIAMNTQINRKSLAQTEQPELEKMTSKAELLAALKVQSSVTAPLNDSGMIPGDHKGAAGLDKTFMSHLRRNWTRPLEGTKKKRIKRPTSTVRAAPKPRKRVKAKRVKSSVVKAVRIRNKSLKPKVQVSKASKNSAYSLIRKRTSMAQDDVDKEALKTMKTMRVTWSELEDRTLILTKVAIKFACSVDAQSNHYISGSTIRDILHWRTEQGLNKTSKSCSRRITYLIKMRPAIKEQLALQYEQLRANQEFNSKYRNLIDRLKKIYAPEDVHDAVRIHLVEMVHRLHQIFNKQFLTNQHEMNDELTYDLPNDYRELCRRYTITNPADMLIDRKYSEPKTTNDAEIAMIAALIHSSVCCSQDKSSYTFQLFEVYKKYTDSHLSAAVTQLKRANVISVKKRNKNKDNSILPYSFSPYHLSIRYGVQLQSVHVVVELYDEYTQAIKTLSASEGSYQMNNLNCGWIFTLAELLSSEKITLSYDIADKLVMVDPALRIKSNFDKISDNYLKMMNKETSEKEKKNVKIEDANNETFLFSDDPIEIFLKMDRFYLHAFCILKAFKNREEVKGWKILEDGECSLSSCVVTDDIGFACEILKIADETSGIVEDILNRPTSDTSNVITKQNFIQFFDKALLKHRAQFEENSTKDFGGRAVAHWHKLSASDLLETILRITTEPALDEDSWLSEYKKISRKTDDDGLDDIEGDHIKHSKMFHQLKDLNLNARTSDSFVVNLSTIYVDIKNGPGQKISFDGSEVDELLQPFSEQDRAGFNEKILSDVKFKPEDLEVKDLFKELTNAGITNTLDIMQISEVCELVQSKAQMGATSTDLVKVFSDKQRLQKQIETLIRLRFVFRAGVIETRFIHKDYIYFWYIDTFFLSRAGVEGAQKSLADEGNKKRKNNEGDLDEPQAKKARIQDVAGPSRASTSKEVPRDDAQQPDDAIKKPPMIRNPIRVRPSPWVRVNGTLNRRVIDKWLGTILNTLTLSPCMMLTDLLVKFNVLTPFDIRYLCEVLEMIGSVQMMTMSEPENDFFSTYTGTAIEPATFFCPSDQIFVEVKEDAMLRLSFFIGRKKYKTPFA